MGMQEQIEQVNNPQEFTKLCNTIFLAIYGPAYAVIDGTRGDEGNDGFISSERRLLAIYCTIKPVKDTDSKYMKKIITDLDKAKTLRDSGKYPIEKWTLVTPRKLSSALLSYLMQEAARRGFEGSHLEATFLANKIYEHPHLLREFPWLHVIDLDSRMEKIEKVISMTSKIPVPDKPLPSTAQPERKSDDLNKALEICNSGRTKENKGRLKAFYYQTTDNTARLQCILALLAWYSPINDKLGDQLAYCEEGLSITAQLSAYRERAIILSYKGWRLSELFCEEDTDAAYKIKAGNAIGFQLLSEEQRQAIISRLNKLDAEAEQAFAEAENIARRIGTHDVLGEVYTQIGNAAGLRYIHLNLLGVEERAEREKALCKRALLLAKDIYAAVGDELQVGYAMHNLANQIRSFGEIAEATTLAEEARAIGVEHRDIELQRTAKALLRRLKSGKAPDYVHGESFGDEPA